MKQFDELLDIIIDKYPITNEDTLDLAPMLELAIKTGMLKAAAVVEEKSRVEAWQPGLTDGRHYAKAIREVAND